MVYADASCVSSGCRWGVLCSSLYLRYGRPLLFLFWSVLSRRTWRFPHPEENNDRSKATNKMNLFLLCFQIHQSLQVPNSQISSMFHILLSAKQPDLIMETFAGLSFVVIIDLVFSGFTNNSPQKTKFLLHSACLIHAIENEFYRDIYVFLIMVSIVILK